MKITHNNNTFDINIHPKPNNCKECPFLRYHADDEYSGYDLEYCMFGQTETFGRYINRPNDCPLDKNNGNVIDIEKRT